MIEGKRLSQPLADEIKRIIYAPRLASEQTDCFAQLSAVNMAHLLMLAEARILEPATAATIARAMLEIDTAGPDAMQWDPAREDAYYNYEARLVELAGMEAGGQIHVGRSRNDIGATIDRMRVREWCLRLGKQLCLLQGAFLNRALQHTQTVMSGYTHLQPAQPITYGFYLLGIAEALQRDGQRLRSAFENANKSPLGAGALAGTSFKIDRRRSAALLGFHALIEHAQDAVASRDFVIDALNACVSIALTWSRFAQDIYVWSTHEFGLIQLPDRIAGTSSIMPQKKNPVILEHLKAKAAHAIGQLVSMLASVRASHFTMSIDGCRASTSTAWPLFKDVEESLVLTQLVVEQATPAPQRMLDEARLNFSTTTDLADALVNEHGLSFRQAHHIVGAAVARLVNEGKRSSGLSSTLLDAAAQTIIGRSLGASNDWLLEKLDPRCAVESRCSLGGAAPVEVERLIDNAKRRLRQQEEELDALATGLADAATRLCASVRALVD